MSEIRIETGSLANLPTAEDFNPENGNLIYISTDEPAMYVFTTTIDKNYEWHKHVLRVSDFPTELWRIDQGSFVSDTDYMLFDSSGSQSGRGRTLKKGKFPSMFTGADTARILDTLFPNQLTQRNISSNNSIIATTDSFTVKGNDTVLISLGLKEYQFRIIPSGTTNKNNISWEYLESFLHNNSDTEKSYYIEIQKLNSSTSFSTEELKNIKKYLRIASTDNTQELFYAKLASKIAEIEAKLKNITTAPFNLKVVETTSAMNEDISKIYLYAGETSDNIIKGHIYFYNNGWNDLGLYVNNPSDIENRLTALEELGLVVSNNDIGTIEVEYSFENLHEKDDANNPFYPMMKSSSDEFFNILTTLKEGNSFPVMGTWNQTYYGLKWLRGYQAYPYQNIPKGTYKFKMQNTLPDDCEILLGYQNTMRNLGQNASQHTSQLNIKSAEQLKNENQNLYVLDSNNSEAIIELKDSANLSTVFRIKPNGHINSLKTIKLEVFLLKGGSRNPLLLDITGEQILKALQDLTISEEKLNYLQNVMLNPSKYIANLGSTALIVLSDTEILSIINHQNNHVSVNNSTGQLIFNYSSEQ